MRRADLYFKLPTRLIAQKPISDPERSGLLVLSRTKTSLTHDRFKNLADHLDPGDLLVLNDTAVVPTRMWGVLDTGGQVEVTLVVKEGEDAWDSVIRPARRLRKGAEIILGNGKLVGRVAGTTGFGGWRLKFHHDKKDRFYDILRKIAQINLPFYIKRDLESAGEYQTVYAKVPGSTQCPTAGLHFTRDLLRKLKEKGIRIGFITLHIGGSALPLSGESFNDFRLYKEHFEVNGKIAEEINKTKRAGKKVVAVGTTTIRALESAAKKDGVVCAKKGWTILTIKPGHVFRAVDAFLTNFHLPASSHLLLTCAFGGVRRVLAGYGEALKKGYRFLDFGDSMLILK